MKVPTPQYIRVRTWAIFMTPFQLHVQSLVQCFMASWPVSKTHESKELDSNLSVGILWSYPANVSQASRHKQAFDLVVEKVTHFLRAQVVSRSGSKQSASLEALDILNHQFAQRGGSQAWRFCKPCQPLHANPNWMYSINFSVVEALAKKDGANKHRKYGKPQMQITAVEMLYLLYLSFL